MDLKPKRSWLLGALAVFAILLVIWLAAAFRISGVQAGGVPFPFSLQSKLVPDYSASDEARAYGSLRLSIVSDVLRDLGLSDQEVNKQGDDILDAMGSPVPTATALNFEGDAPYTPTPTQTHTPTKTYTPTETFSPTATKTRISPTRTPSKTPKPTDPPKPTKTPGPSATPDPTATYTPRDVIDPQIYLSSADWNPTPGSLDTCTVSVSDIEVRDSIVTYGINRVRLKYPCCGSWEYSNPLSESGSMEPSGWVGFYSGSVSITGYESGQSVTIGVYAEDVAGNTAFVSDGATYTLSVDCNP